MRAVSPSHAQSTARLTLLVVLGSESILFGTLLMVSLFFRANYTGNEVIDQSDLLIPVLNTLILLISAGTAWWTLRSIRLGDVERCKNLLVVTLALGLVFVGGQIFEFNRSGMRPDDQELGGMFFTLMGFHALHVLIGVGILAINSVRARLGDFSAHNHVAVEIGSWFWYYVTGVWFVLFAVLYLL